MNVFEGAQLDMFEDALIEPRATSGIVWSYSRRQVLEQCPRRYYYQYYGSVANKAKGETQKETLKFLKTLSNRYMWAGKILHSLIRQYLLGLQRGEHQRLESLLNQAKATYHTGPNNSLASKQGRQRMGLLEFYYGLGDAERLCAECEERLLVALSNFATGSAFAPFVRGGAQPEARIEEHAKLETGHSRASGRIDLSYVEGSRVVIVDWKLGGPGNADESLQLSFYALWGVQAYHCSCQDISLYRAHLCDDLIAPFPISENTLRRTRTRILQDLERMQALDEYGKNAVVEAFSPCSQHLVCALCPFQAVCPKEP